MYDVQQFEQPPAEIIKDLAPGLKFDENGVPVMPNLGAGAMSGNGDLPDLGNIALNMQMGQCTIS